MKFDFVSALLGMFVLSAMTAFCARFGLINERQQLITALGFLILLLVVLWRRQ